MKKIALGLSGGVDSAVAAYLLKQQGYHIDAVYIMCWKMPGCRAEVDRQDAVKVALQFELPFQVLDLRREYKTKVMDYFYAEYKAGRTPNPDILCNREIKFGLFYDWAIQSGYEAIATGHYARCSSSLKTQNSNHTTGDWNLLTAKDLNKDQSYFLYQIKKEQLPHILFPIGDFLKSEIRSIAREKKIVVAEKKDSMGICFVGDVNVHKMLEERYGKKFGEVQLSDGTVIGEHEGYWFFTIGQRGGWKFKSKIQSGAFNMTELPKLYVIGINRKENVIIVGEREEGQRTEFTINDIHWIGNDQNLRLSENIFIKIRNTGAFISSTLLKLKDNQWQVRLLQPEFGVASGQSAVIYQKISDYSEYKLLGGGVIFQ